MRVALGVYATEEEAALRYAQARRRSGADSRDEEREREQLHEADEAGEVVGEEHAAEAPPVVLWMMWCQHDPG